MMKMQKLKLEDSKYSYDSFADVLYVSFGAPKESYCEEITNDILARFSFESDELSGVTIVDASKQKNLLKDLSFLSRARTKEIIGKVSTLQ